MMAIRPDPDPLHGKTQCYGSGISAFLTPGSGMVTNSRSGFGMNIPDHIFESLETIFWVKIFKYLYADPDPGSWNLFYPGSGMEKKFGSGINIPGPQHW